MIEKLINSLLIVFTIICNILLIAILSKGIILVLSYLFKFSFYHKILIFTLVIIITCIAKIFIEYKHLEPIKNSRNFTYYSNKGNIYKTYNILFLIQNPTEEVIHKLMKELFEEVLPFLFKKYRGINMEFTLNTHLINPLFISTYQKYITNLKNQFPGFEYKIRPVSSFSKTFGCIVVYQPAAMVIWLIKKLKGIHDKFPWIINKQWYEITFINRQSTSNPPPSHPKT